jgi:hypothetical protein
MVAFTKELSDVLDRSTATQFMQCAPLMAAVPGSVPPPLDQSPWQQAVNGFMARVAADPSQVSSARLGEDNTGCSWSVCSTSVCTVLVCSCCLSLSLPLCLSFKLRVEFLRLS